MKPSSNLFDLIKSLTKSEKRFFKLSSALQSGDKNYMRLFDEIEKQDTYDEKHLKKIFEKETFIKHLPSEKSHLYKLILKSLRGFHADNSISSVLKQEIKNIEILYNKALFKECRKFLKRAKAKAKEYEKFYYWFELISWEKRLIEEEYEQGIFSFDLEQLIQEELEVIEKLRNLAEYQMIFSQINAIFRTGLHNRPNEELATVEEIANHHLIKGKNTALSSRAATICYYIQGICNATQRNYPVALTKFSRTLEILDNNPKIKIDLAKRYVSTLKNLIFCNIDAYNLKEAQRLIDLLKNLSGTTGFNSLDVRLKIFTFSSNTQIIVYDHLGEFQKAKETVLLMEEGLEKFKHQINKEQKVLFYYNIAYVYFGVKEYKLALKWINKVVNDNERKLRQDIYTYGELLNLLIHFELGNYDLVEYLSKTSRRQLQRNKLKKGIEVAFIKLVLSLIKKNQSERKNALNKFSIRLTKEYSTPEDSAIKEYIDIEAWVRSKMENISFEEAVKKRYSDTKGRK
ncbi:MAG: hypothetical protein N4A35_00390 [Flavobacteriales bacterium]|jgi:tetratricopeptide (TPR) repeat protein|nr:hypothetical protein [Flavobacteriales bacterium]